MMDGFDAGLTRFGTMRVWLGLGFWRIIASLVSLPFGHLVYKIVEMGTFFLFNVAD